MCPGLAKAPAILKGNSEMVAPEEAFPEADFMNDVTQAP